MALDSAIRWQLVRDVIVQKKSGVIVVQMGKNYLNWIVEEGHLICVSSTFADASFTQFVQNKGLKPIRNEVDPVKSFGHLLVRQQILDPEQLSSMLFEHWVACTDYLFDPAAHLFWSTNIGALKQEFIRCDRLLAEVILQANNSAITIPTALRVVQELKPPFRIQAQSPNLSLLNEEERRVWMYLQSGCSMKQIFQDRELARIPCYKALFRFWLCGYISDSRKAPVVLTPKISTNVLQKIPPEWVIPLCAGALIGVILAPSSPPDPLPQPTYNVEPLKEALQKPAWSTENENEDFNAETQRSRDEGE